MVRCIFCGIIKGKINTYKIYEDNETLCILDNNPISKGHCLIIPKAHCSDIYDIDKELLKKLMVTAKNLATMLKNKIGVKGVNIFHASGRTAQQSIFHFHFHLVPRYPNDGINAWPKSQYKERNFENVLKSLSNSKS